MQNVMRRIRRLVAVQGSDHLSDELLLQQFLHDRSEEAFAALVHRHGAMVLGVCLRLLHHRQDAEDAFQATFLTLVRKGQSIRQPGALSGWLYRVAYRIAVRARSRATRQVLQECLGDIAVDSDPAAALAWSELRPVLDTELNRLPRKYRTPMILCYLEGKSYEEVAAEMGCPKGTVAVRLLRGRKMLKDRLLRRGLMQAGGWVAAREALPAASALVPPLLAATTVGAGAKLAGGMSLTAVASSTVAVLVQEACKVLAWQKAKLSLVTVLLLGLTATSVGTWSRSGAGLTLRNSPAETAFVSPPAPRVEAKTAIDPHATAAMASTTQKAEKPSGAESACELAPPPVAIEPARPAARMQRHVCISIEISGGVSSSGEPVWVLRKSVQRDDVDSVVVVLPSHTPSRLHYASGLALRAQLLDEPNCERLPAESTPPPSAAVANTRTTSTIVILPKSIIVIEAYPLFLRSSTHRIIIISSASFTELGLPQMDARD
jgi:RNA polymerase sigma factor (sigma-70 family)